MPLEHHYAMLIVVYAAHEQCDMMMVVNAARVPRVLRRHVGTAGQLRAIDDDHHEQQRQKKVESSLQRVWQPQLSSYVVLHAVLEEIRQDVATGEAEAEDVREKQQERWETWIGQSAPVPKFAVVARPAVQRHGKWYAESGWPAKRFDDIV